MTRPIMEGWAVESCTTVNAGRLSKIQENVANQFAMLTKDDRHAGKEDFHTGKANRKDENGERCGVEES
jgi:hypothetical protein